MDVRGVVQRRMWFGFRDDLSWLLVVHMNLGAEVQAHSGRCHLPHLICWTVSVLRRRLVVALVHGGHTAGGVQTLQQGVADLGEVVDLLG